MFRVVERTVPMGRRPGNAAIEGKGPALRRMSACQSSAQIDAPPQTMAHLTSNYGLDGEDSMRDTSFRTLLLAACLLNPRLAMSQVPRQSGTLSVNGYPGQVPVIQVNGKSYVEIEALARLTSSSMSFRDRNIILTFPPSAANTTAPEASRPVQSGFSKEFVRAGIEEMTAIREWRIAIVNAVQSSFPVTDDWVAGYRRSADSKHALTSAAIATDSDRSGFALLSNEFGKMQTLSDKYLALRKSLTYIAPDSLDKDPLDQQILSCARGLSSMAASGQFEDVPACH